MSKSGEIEVKTPSRFVPVLEDKCFRKSSNLILALGMDPSSEPVSIFCHQECFLCISILISFPSASMLRHMNMYNFSSTITPTYHSFWMSSKCCSSLMSLSNFFSRRTLTLSEHLTISECGYPSIFPMSSECQFSVPDLLSRLNKIALTDNLDGLYRKVFNLTCHYFDYWRERAIRECEMLSREEQSCDRNDRSSYHCSKN